MAMIVLSWKTAWISVDVARQIITGKSTNERELDTGQPDIDYRTVSLKSILAEVKVLHTLQKVIETLISQDGHTDLCFEPNVVKCH